METGTSQDPGRPSSPALQTAESLPSRPRAELSVAGFVVVPSFGVEKSLGPALDATMNVLTLSVAVRFQSASSFRSLDHTSSVSGVMLAEHTFCARL